MAVYVELRPKDTDPPEALARKRKTAEDLLALRRALHDHFQAHRKPNQNPLLNVRIATWNLRDFGKDLRGERLKEALAFIAEIISHFDVVALQEIYRDLKAFSKLRSLLGPDWDFIMTDASTSNRGNDERMVFVFNRNSVRSLNLAGEISLADHMRLLLPNSFDVAPKDGLEIHLPAGGSIGQPDPGAVAYESGSDKKKLKREVVLPLPKGTRLTLPQGAELVFRGRPAELRPDKTFELGTGRVRSFAKGAYVRVPPAAVEAEDLNFARAPFLVQFQAKWLRFSLCTVHIYYGEEEEGLKLERRKAEIRQIAAALEAKARSENDSDADSFFILLGDFNIVGRSHGTMQALESSGFVVPDEIRTLPAGSNVKRDKFYDQIAVWMGEPGKKPRFADYAKIEVVGAGVFDYYKHVFRHGGQDPDKGDESYFKERMEQEVAAGRAKRTYRYSDWRTYQMSDHLPMWIELRADFADEYISSALEAVGAKLNPP